MGRPVPGVDYKKVTQRLMSVADVSFRDASGKGIPASQAIAGAKEWWASLNKTNQKRNADIAKMRAPQKPTNTEGLEDDLEDDPDRMKNLEKEFLKTLSPKDRKRYGKKMYDVGR